jgi:hypothetical protein
VLRIRPDAIGITNARDAVVPIVIPIISQELINLFQLVQKITEDVTGMPMLLQGQQGAATDTVGGMQILSSNSSATRRNLAQLFDDDLITPHISAYYEWLMQYSENDKAKGDFQVIARGSTAMFEKDAAAQALMQLVPMVANPESGLDITKIIGEFCRSHRIDQASISFTDEEKKTRAKAMAEQPPPEDPAMAVAKVRAQAEMEKSKLVLAGSQEEMALKAALAKAEFVMKSQEAELDRQHGLRLAEMSLQQHVLSLSQAKDISIQEINAQLAQTTQKLVVQAKLSQADGIHKQTITPPTEPAGRADVGRAFEQ